MEAPPDNDVLWARSLHFTHRDGSPALQGVSLGVRVGEILAVSGPRGCSDVWRDSPRPSAARSGSTACPCTRWAR